MTSFDIYESSVQDSRPLEVYRFALGVREWLYTSAEDEITVGADTYTPLPIARSAIEQGAESSSRTLTVTMPGNDSFATQYVNVAPGQKATVSIIRLQRDESPTFNTQALIFKGVVQSVRFPDNGQVAEVALRSIETLGNLKMPRYGYAGLCQHVLYGPGCGVDPTPHTHTGLVTAVSGNTITVAGAGASGHDFVGGYCHPTGFNEFRLVISVSGDVLTLLLPFSVDMTGASMQCLAGCDHKIDGDCGQVFDNVLEFGGFPWVPNLNPFDGIIIV